MSQFVLFIRPLPNFWVLLKTSLQWQGSKTQKGHDPTPSRSSFSFPSCVGLLFYFQLLHSLLKKSTFRECTSENVGPFCSLRTSQMHFSCSASVLRETWSVGSFGHGSAAMSLITLASSPTCSGAQEACEFLSDGGRSALWQLPQYNSHPSGR